MHKNLLFIVGVVSMFSLLAMFAGYTSITGALVEEHDETYELGTEILKHARRLYPGLESIQLAKQDYDPRTLPSREQLTPEFITFQVDRIPIYQPNYAHYLPIDKKRIHTYSGSAGYYAKDPRPYVDGYLCSYAYKVLGAPLQCEIVPLGFVNGKITFAIGTAEDEYIARRAIGTDWAGLWFVANSEHGILAASPVAYLRFFR